MPLGKHGESWAVVLGSAGGGTRKPWGILGHVWGSLAWTVFWGYDSWVGPSGSGSWVGTGGADGPGQPPHLGSYFLYLCWGRAEFCT